MADFTFPADKPANLLFRVSNSLNGSEDAHVEIDRAGRKVSGWVLTGAFCGRRANGGVNNRKSYYRLYFSASFDRAFSTTGTWKDGTLSPGATSGGGGEGYATGADRAGRGSGGWVGFDTSSDNDVRMRLGISYVSRAGAEANLREEIAPRASVDQVATGGITGLGPRAAFRTRRRRQYAPSAPPSTPRSTTRSCSPTWSATPTAAIRAWTARRIASTRGQGAQYSNFSGWDQYRAQIQLLALLKPRIAGDFAQSLYNFARQNGGVWDRWVHINGADACDDRRPVGGHPRHLPCHGGPQLRLPRRLRVPGPPGHRAAPRRALRRGLPGPVHRPTAQSGPVLELAVRGAGRLPLLGRCRRDP